jgi:hypothetical protein
LCYAASMCDFHKMKEGSNGTYCTVNERDLSDVMRKSQNFVCRSTINSQLFRNTLSCYLKCKAYSVQDRNLEHNICFWTTRRGFWSSLILKCMSPCNIIAS